MSRGPALTALHGVGHRRAKKECRPPFGSTAFGLEEAMGFGAAWGFDAAWPTQEWALPPVLGGDLGAIASLRGGCVDAEHRPSATAMSLLLLGQGAFFALACALAPSGLALASLGSVA